MDHVPCTSCGTISPVAHRYCTACGTGLARTAAHELRRFVTVVNSDLKGSTALGEKLDPESLREVLTWYFDEMQVVFESHGGTIEKIIGDAIVAVFGLPVAREDDALRALRAAAESQAVLATLNDQLDARYGVRLVNRTGISSGDVVFGEATAGQHVLTGDTMTISSAMEQNAPPLEVLVAEPTLRLLRAGVTLEPFGPVTPKGKNLPVEAHRLVSVSEAVPAAADLARPTDGQDAFGDGGAPADGRAGGPTACRRCGEASPPGAAFCAACGASLAESGTVRESRKTVTLVFADPKPVTLDGAPPSPEALRDVMFRYFETMQAALEHHGGTVEKFIGDAVMAVFGLPVRHEDDAIRAVRAAADMQAALPALNDEFRVTWGIELRNHIGVNTGEVIAGDASSGQRLVTGDAVNTAARLEQAAGPAEIILGELTYRLAQEGVEVEVIPPLVLKGKAEPVRAYRLVSIREQPAQRNSRMAPFIGREAELGRLSEALVDAEGHGRARIVTVIGDAGVGKSRLIREFTTAHAGGARIVKGRCLAYGNGITFWPIAEIVRGLAGISAADPPATAMTKIGAILAEVAGPGGSGPEIANPEELAAIEDRLGVAMGLVARQYPVAELFWAIRKLLELLAHDRPLVAILDDIHSAETTFLDLLDHLLEAVEGAPILLLCGARHELLDLHTEWSAAHADGQIVLGPLSGDDTGRMIEELLGSTGLDPLIRDRIVGAAEGNPLFVEQMVSMLVDDGMLRREGDRWISDAAADSVVVPPTIHALLAARLDNLGAVERGVVEPAAVVGNVFAQAAVAELVEAQVRAAVGDHLGSLSRRQFVRPDAAASEPTYRFGHALIRDTAYGSLLKRDRVELHERFVTWAERINRERGRETEFEEILGFHLEQAYRYRAELGPIDAAGLVIGERAATKLAAAGRRAFARGDLPAAVGLLRRVTALLPDASPFRIEVLADLGEALISQGAFDEAVGVLDEGARLAGALGDVRLAARVAVIRLLLEVYGASGEGSASNAIGQAKGLIETLTPLGDDAGLARTWLLVMHNEFTLGNLDAAAEAADRVVEHATRIGDQRLAAKSAPAIAYVLVHGPTPAREAIERCEELLAGVQGDRKNEAIVLSALAQVRAMNGEFEAARELYRRYRSTLVELGSGVEALATSIESSRVELLAGDVATAEQELRRDDEALAEIDERYFRSTVAAILAHVLVRRGALDNALDYARLAEEIADADDVWSQVAWRTARAKVLAVRGDVDPAVALARAAVDLAAPTQDVELRAETLADLGDVLRLVGREEAAGPPLREALALYELKGDVPSAASVRVRLESLGGR